MDEIDTTWIKNAEDIQETMSSSDAEHMKTYWAYYKH